jgi:hypothetical protein
MARVNRAKLTTVVRGHPVRHFVISTFRQCCLVPYGLSSQNPTESFMSGDDDRRYHECRCIGPGANWRINHTLTGLARQQRDSYNSKPLPRHDIE